MRQISESAYDANGNTLTKSDSSGTAQYSWDVENRLTQAVVPGVGTTTFRYDPIGRRIRKSKPSGTINFIHAGIDIRGNAIEEVDNNENILKRCKDRRRNWEIGDRRDVCQSSFVEKPGAFRLSRFPP